MSDVNKVEGDAQLTHMLDMRQQLAEQMAAVDRELQILLIKKKRESFQPLTQLTIQEMVAEHMGQLKVKELTLFADIAPATYYKIINRVEAVKIGTLKALLNTLGLDLFIGQKEQQASLASPYPSEVKR